MRGDSARTMRPYARMAGMPLWCNSLAALERSMRSGRPALEAVDTQGLWPYLRQRPGEAGIFDHAMTAKADAAVAGVLAVYDFARFSTLVDVGGGRGHLLRAVLDAVPSATGVLFDLPDVIGSVVASAPRTSCGCSWRAPGSASRGCSRRPGRCASPKHDRAGRPHTWWPAR